MARTNGGAGKAVIRKPAQPGTKKAAKTALPDHSHGTVLIQRDTPQAKAKLVRDSFTIPKDEYLVLGALKERASHLRRPTKKSELLRAGIAALHAMNNRAFLAALMKVPSLKTGRPKEGEADAAR